MQPDVTPFFTIATTSSGSPNTAIRFWKARCGSGYERLSGRSARNGSPDRLPLGMDQHIKNFSLSIHGTPEIDQTTVDLEIDLVEMPHGMWLRPAFAKIDRDLDPIWGQIFAAIRLRSFSTESVNSGHREL